MLLHRLLFLLIFSCQFTAWAQHAEKHLVIVLPDIDTSRLRYTSISFDTGTGYCFYAHSDATIVFTNSGTYGPFKKEDRRGMASLFFNEKDKDQYIKSTTRPVVYGPIDG